LVGGKTHADTIYTGPNQIKREEKEMKKQSTMKCPNCFRVLRTSSPDSIPLLPWPIRSLSVKLVNQISGVFKVFRRFPAGAYVVITGPLDEIMQLPIAPPRVEYVVDFPFLCFLDYH